MDQSVAVSIIVPMYNTEAYVAQCINSLRNQSLKNIEIVLVDDGSPDQCGRIADVYQQKDSRIKVVHRSNGGLGPARNTGVEIATGDFIGFVDSDDWVEPQMYEQLYSAAVVNNAQIVYGGVKVVLNEDKQYQQEHPFANRTLRGEQEIFELRRGFYGALPAHVKDDPTHMSACFGIYSRKLIEENDLKFFNIRSEDIFFNIQACIAARVITCIEETNYCYRCEEHPSITQSFHPNIIESFLQLFQKLEDMATNETKVYRDECRLRAKRRIIDYCRVLIKVIESSSKNNDTKQKYVKEVLAQPALKRACAGYPFLKLPVMQMIFYLCLKFKIVWLSRLLVRMRQKLNAK